MFFLHLWDPRARPDPHRLATAPGERARCAQRAEPAYVHRGTCPRRRGAGRGNRALVRAECAGWLPAPALEVDDARAEAGARRYRLPVGHAKVLLDREHLSSLAPLVCLIVSVERQMPTLLTALREGVAWQDFGADAWEAQADLNRPVFLNVLTTEWLPAILRRACAPAGGSAGAAGRYRRWGGLSAAAAGVADRVTFLRAGGHRPDARGALRPGDRLRDDP